MHSTGSVDLHRYRAWTDSLPYRTVLFDIGETLIKVPRPAAVYQRLLARHGARIDLPEVEAILAEARRKQDELYPQWVTDDLRLDRDATAGRRDVHVNTVVELAAV